jgi:hypothetical protein
MKIYTFENVLNLNIRIEIKARSHNEALDLLILTTRYSEDFKVI